MIQIDSREQKNNHITGHFDKSGIGYFRSKLYVGDYADVINQSVVVDRKQDIVELAGNICGSQHERFRDECKRAQKIGVKLIVLIEETSDITTWESPKRRNGKPLTNVKGSTLKKAMDTMSERYGVEFRQVGKASSAETILKILSEEQSNDA